MTENDWQRKMISYKYIDVRIHFTYSEIWEPTGCSGLYFLCFIPRKEGISNYTVSCLSFWVFRSCLNHSYCSIPAIECSVQTNVLANAFPRWAPNMIPNVGVLGKNVLPQLGLEPLGYRADIIPAELPRPDCYITKVVDDFSKMSSNSQMIGGRCKVCKGSHS